MKFSNDISDKYRMPTIQLDDEARNMFVNYCWNGNVRQLKNVTEQISIVEQNRIITADILKKYLPTPTTNLPVVFNSENNNSMSEREMLYGVFV